MIAVGVLAASAVVLAPSDGKRADCRASLESPAGAYPSLAAVDEEGYVLPFSRVNLDDGAVWELRITAKGSRTESSGS